MPKNFNPKIFYRIIDANLNRAKEGLRVCEEFTRFILNDYLLTSKLKKVRHGLQEIINQLPIKKYKLIEARDSDKDVGKNILANEIRRDNYLDIVFANIGRAKESARVLEEFSKLVNKNAALNLKKIRYLIYDIEKRIIKKLKLD